MNFVFIGPDLRFDAGKPILYRVQDGEAPESLPLEGVAALMAVTHEDPVGWDKRHDMKDVLITLIRDGLPVDRTEKTWPIHRSDLMRFADRIHARLGYWPPGLAAWLGEPVEVTSELVPVSTRRLRELLKYACPTIDSLIRERSRTPWLARCATPDPDAGNGALQWDYWVAVDALRNHGKLVTDAPDPRESIIRPHLTQARTHRCAG